MLALAFGSACGPALSATVPSGKTIAAGRLRDDVVAEVTAEARRRVQCAGVDSIAVTNQRIEPGAQVGSDGSLRIGSASERWEASLCGAVVGFTVTFTGNGMLGVNFSLQKD